MSSSRSPRRDFGSSRGDYESRYDYHGRDDRRSPPSRAHDSYNDYQRRSPPPEAERYGRYKDHEHDNRRQYDQRDYPSRGYRDRDREGYRSPGYNHSRSRSRSPVTRKAGQPNREVMLDGLALDIVEEDISACLKRDYNIAILDEVRIIRDKQTRQSRGFGFIKFPGLQQAEDFVHQNFPTIYLSKEPSLDDNEAAKVRIAYSRERNPGDSSMDGDWTCQNCQFRNFAGRKVCFKCQSPYSQAAQVEAAKPTFVNNGESDVSLNGAPSQFLLIRGLEPSVSEDLLYKGVAKLFKPGVAATQVQNQGKKGKVSSTTGDANLGAKEGSLRRILLIRDRESNESWRYGFAEYASIDDAQAALTRFNSFDKFTISSKPVYVSFVHPGVFVPVFNVTAELEPFTFFPWANTATRLQYWDENACVSQLFLADPNEALDDTTKARSAADEAALAAQKEGIVAVGEEADAKAKKRKTESKDMAKVKKSAPAHLEFWSNRHAELHGQKPKETAATETNSKEFKNTETARNSGIYSDHVRSYAHPEKHCCYLCSRQFKSGAEVNKHERLSDLHKKNLDDEELKAQALLKMKKAGVSTDAPNPEADTAEYRDRAKERRKAFGSTNPLSTKKINLPMKATAEAEPAAPKSKGAALLGKMGWNSGEGLGAAGTGVTAPIQTDIYAAGVGLGAQGGKLGDASEEADRNTRGGYAEFVERAKDKAKERYLNMQ